MSPGLLRERRRGHAASVTSVELFFDLVFVITVTQISHGLLEDLSWGGALRAAMLLLTIWWAWIDTAWITNWLDPNKPLVRLLLFVLMGLGLVISSSLPEAFGERGLTFAVAFVAFQLGRTLFMLWAVRGDATLRRNFVRIFIWYAAGAVFWLAGGFAEGELRFWLWLVGRHPRRQFRHGRLLGAGPGALRYARMDHRWRPHGRAERALRADCARRVDPRHRPGRCRTRMDAATGVRDDRGLAAVGRHVVDLFRPARRRRLSRHRAVLRSWLASPALPTPTSRSSWSPASWCRR